jgi:hypothetical protein
LYFGRHKGQPLPDVPSDYLSWVLREVKLSSGLRNAVADELARRGVEPPPAPPVPTPTCWHCKGRQFRHRWHIDAIGRRRVRRECLHCRRWAGFAPNVEPFTTEADVTASPTGVLDLVTMADQWGIRLISDGRRVTFAPGEWARAPQELRDLVFQAGHAVARMAGKASL